MSRLKKFTVIFSFIAAAGVFLIPGSSEFLSKHTTAEENELRGAAVNLLQTFSGEERKKFVFDFNANERKNWNYVPADREGIPLKMFSAGQKKLLRKLLEFSLSKSGIEKADGVLILEKVLQDLSGGGPFRDPGKYYVTFFGRPETDIPWGWRYEGHHLSLNFTVIKESIIVSTPMFFGANPAEVKEGEHKGLRVLKYEEDYGLLLIKSLDESQLKQALIRVDAPGEIITGNEQRADPLNPKGIPASKLKNNQRDILFGLIKEYVNNSHPKRAEQKNTDLSMINLNELFFAWAGESEKGRPHYYRIQSSPFLIEYDNTQNNANHIHSVWRDFKNDFGEDVLSEHYREFHK